MEDLRREILTGAKIYSPENLFGGNKNLEGLEEFFLENLLKRFHSTETDTEKQQTGNNRAEKGEQEKGEQETGNNRAEKGEQETGNNGADKGEQGTKQTVRLIDFQEKFKKRLEELGQPVSASTQQEDTEITRQAMVEYDEGMKKIDEALKRAFTPDKIRGEVQRRIDCEKQKSSKIAELIDKGKCLVKAKCAQYARKLEEIETEYDLGTAEREERAKYIKKYGIVLKQLKQAYQDRLDRCNTNLEELKEEQNLARVERIELISNRDLFLHNSEEKKDYVRQKDKLTRELRKAIKKDDLRTVEMKAIELKLLIENNPLVRIVGELDKKIELKDAEISRLGVEIANCEQQMRLILKKSKEKVKSLKSLKENRLVEVRKQSIWQRIKGFVVKLSSELLDQKAKQAMFEIQEMDPYINEVESFIEKKSEERDIKLDKKQERKEAQNANKENLREQRRRQRIEKREIMLASIQGRIGKFFEERIKKLEAIKKQMEGSTEQTAIIQSGGLAEKFVIGSRD